MRRLWISVIAMAVGGACKGKESQEQRPEPPAPTERAAEADDPRCARFLSTLAAQPDWTLEVRETVKGDVGPKTVHNWFVLHRDGKVEWEGWRMPVRALTLEPAEVDRLVKSADLPCDGKVGMVSAGYELSSTLGASTALVRDDSKLGMAVAPIFEAALARYYAARKAELGPISLEGTGHTYYTADSSETREFEVNADGDLTVRRKGKPVGSTKLDPREMIDLADYLLDNKRPVSERFTFKGTLKTGSRAVPASYNGRFDPAYAAGDTWGALGQLERAVEMGVEP